jgi:hypothetical protein
MISEKSLIKVNKYEYVYKEVYKEVYIYFEIYEI